MEIIFEPMQGATEPLAADFKHTTEITGTDISRPGLLRALTMLNEMGDVTLVWEEQNDAAMEALIQKRMNEGITFFIITPRLGGLVAPDRTKLENAAEAMKHRALSIPDEEVQKFVSGGLAEVISTPIASVKGSRRSKSAKEVSKSESVGVRQRRGG